MIASFGPTQVIARLIPLPGALAALDSVMPVAEREIPTAESAGHVLAADITAPSMVPGRAQALYDGFAVRAEETLDASTHAPVLLTNFTPVVTGTPLPDTADAIAAYAAVQLRGSVLEITAHSVSGEGVLTAGGDCSAGARLRRAGSRVHASDAAVLMLAGVTHVKVRTPRLCIFCARESTSLRAAANLLAHELKLQNINAEVTLLDDALGITSADAVIGIGGTGAGANDKSVQTLAKAGRVVFHGVGMTPGETAAFGFVEKQPVLLMPGRLDATLAVWRILGTRLLARLCGSNETEAVTSATLTRKVTSTVGMAEFVLLRMEGEKAEPIAAKYLPLSSLASADAWMLVPPSSEGYQTDTSVAVQRWR